MKDIKDIRKQLLLRKEELMQMFIDQKLQLPTKTEVKDKGDKAFDSIQENLGIALYNNEFEEYKRIQRAIEMLDSGTYGVCEVCNKQITDKRLKVYPNAGKCLACQEAIEAGSLRF